MALLSGPAGSSPPGSAPGRHSARMPEWSHVARRGTNARMAETAHKCNTATLDAVEASIEAWRTAALSEHGDGAKPTPMTGRDCTQVQPSVKASVKAKAQRQGPALRLSVAPWCRLRGSCQNKKRAKVLGCQGATVPWCPNARTARRGLMWPDVARMPEWPRLHTNAALRRKTRLTPA